MLKRRRQVTTWISEFLNSSSITGHPSSMSSIRVMILFHDPSYSIRQVFPKTHKTHLPQGNAIKQTIFRTVSKTNIRKSSPGQPCRISWIISTAIPSSINGDWQPITHCLHSTNINDRDGLVYIFTEIVIEKDISVISAVSQLESDNDYQGSHVFNVYKNT